MKSLIAAALMLASPSIYVTTEARAEQAIPRPQHLIAPLPRGPLAPPAPTRPAESRPAEIDAAADDQGAKDAASRDAAIKKARDAEGK